MHALAALSIIVVNLKTSRMVNEGAAYAPLAQGWAVENPVLVRIGEKHGATAVQITIAWLLDQESVIAIPKAARSSSQRANLDALNIHLDEDDRAAIASLRNDLRLVDPPFAPDWQTATL